MCHPALRDKFGLIAGKQNAQFGSGICGSGFTYPRLNSTQLSQKPTNFNSTQLYLLRPRFGSARFNLLHKKLAELLKDAEFHYFRGHHPYIQNATDLKTILYEDLYMRHVLHSGLG